MKSFILKMLLILGLVVSFASFANADEIVQDFTLEEIVRVQNSPTKNIVDQPIGHQVVMYKWMTWSRKYQSIRGEIVDKGTEPDSAGREYNFVIVYFRNSSNPGGNFYKFTQYPEKKDSALIISGISTVDLPVVHFRVTKNTWTQVVKMQKFGGYTKKKVVYAAL